MFVNTLPLFSELTSGNVDEFIRKTAEDFREAARNPGKAAPLTSLMAYDVGKGERERVMLPMNREYTLQVLYRLGFIWPTTSWDYLKRFLQVLNGLEFFKVSKAQAGRTMNKKKSYRQSGSRLAVFSCCRFIKRGSFVYI
ncbi:MAG: hypothetical protein E7232_07130 [Lachnospiraceae bacterium]|nr:hypothetical protein [Lachnospiraceae bacterium]